MTDKSENPPAFPRPKVLDVQFGDAQDGMTLRDYFAAAAELWRLPRTSDASVEKMTANLDAALSALAQRGEGMKPTKIPVKAPKPVKEIKPIRAWALADGKHLTCCVHWTRALLMREYEGTSLKPVRVEIRVLGGKK